MPGEARSARRDGQDVAMEEFDVLIAGGGVAGPVAAKFCAAGGLRTLLVEKDRIPREKPCSGIQFPYLEKIIGAPIPRDRLCNNALSKVEILAPDGRVTRCAFPMLNYMRDRFDEWLCLEAESKGAEIRDGCAFEDFSGEDGAYTARLRSGDSVASVKARYIIDATGMRPVIRRKSGGTTGFQKGNSGATLNYYFKAEGKLRPDTLYQVWNIDFNNRMFAWVYNKTLGDGRDYWVAGTGYDKNIQQRQDGFFEFVKRRFELSDVEIVKREAFSSTMSLLADERIWLGEGGLLAAGDAAGLVDLTRGVGMDAAALSGRLAAKAVLRSSSRGTAAVREYAGLMRDLVGQTNRNRAAGIIGFDSNERLQEHLDRSMLRTSLRLAARTLANGLRGPERQIMLP
ncbi:MAG: NAD(P)/FAD-dependent oxidoreductase [Spirochaetes bacterium]|nr:NAD(P)/FAD-dependent oxidoreductase [Spirochaetota bacterium]MBU1079643.1 NAD(P)/FAD-dependent oxidoreductase [Spirochaetota bacterium]